MNSLPRVSLHAKLPGILLFASLLLLPFIVSSEGIWMDEAQTWDYASKKTFSDFKAELIQDQASECQMPLAMLASWLWGIMFGLSEYALRSINILWGAIALMGLHHLGRRIGVAMLVPLFAVHPFFWLYMDEARPYVLLMALSVALLLAIQFFIDCQGRGSSWALFFSLVAILGCGSYMLAVVPIGMAALWLLWLAWRKKWRINAAAVLILLGCLIVIETFGLYYAWTLSRGAGGMKAWSPSLLNLAFVAYEFSGAFGLGPSRQSLREFAQSRDMDFLAGNAGSVILVGLYLVVMSLLFMIAIRQGSLRNKPPLFHACLFVGIGSLVVLFSLAMAAGFPVWGRHFSMAFPAFVVVAGMLSQTVWSGKPFNRCLCVVMLAMLLASSLHVRFSPQHAKDADREAAKIAMLALSKGKQVWWAANPSTANYYGISFAQHLNPTGCILFVGNSPKELTLSNPAPDLIILCKPDNYDRQGGVRSAIKHHQLVHQADLPGFSIWSRPSQTK